MNAINYPPQVQFETGVPRTLALKYALGKPCRGGQSLMFTTTTGERFFVHPVVGAKITQLGIQPGEEFEMTRGPGQDFQVKRFPPSGPVNGSGENSAAIMTRCYTQAIDVALAAVEYAKGRNLMLSPSFEDVRALAATICISEARR